MKNKTIRIITLIAALLTLVSLLTVFQSCDNSGVSDQTDASSAEQTTATPEPTEDESVLTLIEAGKSLVTVMRPDEDGTDSSAVLAGKTVRTTLLKYAKTVDIKTDWTKDGKHDSDAVEILCGLTNYEETDEVYETLKYGDYRITLVGNKIVLAGYTADALGKAARKLASLIDAAAVKGDDDTYTVKLDKTSIADEGTADKLLSSFPQLEEVRLAAYYNPGDDCDELILGGATMENFNSNIELLKKAGYTLYTQREINGSAFATLYNDQYTLNVGFIKPDKQLRVVMEPFSPKTLIGLESDNKYEVVTTSQITMMGVEYVDSSGSNVGNGMQILIRLTDGRFIVIDGAFKRAQTRDQLLREMREQSKDYVAKTGGIKVAAWIITHSHGDHNGMINGYASDIKANNVKVERFIVNFMAEEERQKSISSYANNWSASEGSGYTSTYNAAKTLGADVCVAHVGQIFYFADLAIDVLYTVDEYGPTTVNALNATSLILKMTFTDPVTKKVSTYMSTGDATGRGFGLATAIFGSYMKCDVVQVAHHGYTTWGDSEKTSAAYRTIAPSTVLWPQGSAAFPNYKDKDYNKVLLQTNTNPNFKELFVAGKEGTRTIVPLPYEVGKTYVIAP